MAKYQIAAINYIASGDQRTLLNIDTQIVYHNIRNVYILDSENTKLSNIVTEEGDVEYFPTEYIDKEHPLDRRRRRLSGNYKLSSEPLSEENLSNTIILNEQQKYGYDRRIYENKRILLYLSSNALDIEEKLQRFNDDIYRENMTFVAEAEQQTVNDLKMEIGTASQRICPMYDIRDVSIKSCVLKDTLNSNLYQTDEFVDIYAPSMSSYPIEFCQCREDAYVITDVVSDSPGMLYSSLNADRLNYDRQRDFYSMSVSSNAVGEYLYVSKKDEKISAYSQLSSSRFFVPARRMTGIDHNYILQINTQQYGSSYEKGDIYAQQIDLAKNMYDSLYSMNMPLSTSIRECRQYCGINSLNGNIYLKFYDNKNYKQISSQVDPDTGITEMRMQPDGKTKFPFQKVEMYLPNSFKTAATHKSNLFSVRIKKKGIERLVTEESGDKAEKETRERLYQVLKRDIKNACKKIAESAAPVNTQFFDVFFEQ